MQDLLGSQYLTVPLKKRYLVEVPYEPFKKLILLEMQSHDWVCLVDDREAKKQGAKYRTELKQRLLDNKVDPEITQLEKKVEKHVKDAIQQVRYFSEEINLKNQTADWKERRVKRFRCLQACRDFCKIVIGRMEVSGMLAWDRVIFPSKPYESPYTKTFLLAVKLGDFSRLSTLLEIDRFLVFHFDEC